MASALTDPSGIINTETFDQNLELDDDDTHAYTKDMFTMYFAQAPTAFAGMDAALAQTDLRTLADLAHFLMGSSATLALQRVAAVCQRMESIGEASLAADSDSKAAGADGAARAGGATEDALKQIAELLKEGKREYADAERWLKSWYAQHNQTFESAADAAPDPEGEGDAGLKLDAEAAAPLAGSIEKSPAARKAAGIDPDVPPPRPPPTEAATPTPAPKLERQSDKPIAV
ncbi:signal transduction histidine kinase [Mycena albidolilacea]|uniref:Signal transduction histidine kinase n=1 Tax=Mycena albidolilacea TaxID=1033008 RepID=A0AAD7ARH4_9AGAR|nr:signal transduction histidine kinase [Mycena albidolilacea]